MYRIGQGYDLHRLEPGRPFLIGGVELAADVGPVGHSDGDVVLHALIDALLGALGAGDIGDWFPPGEARTRGIDSAILLKEVQATLPRLSIENVDVTIFLERPKLGPHKAAIRERLAHLLGIDVSHISVKAKTAEGLGAIGAGEAVAASVTLLIQMETA
jgi:2-C-methyl-D-erythritol 2,4-cyclodiphosphate synthase